MSSDSSPARVGDDEIDGDEIGGDAERENDGLSPIEGMVADAMNVVAEPDDDDADSEER
jgi:hypothetical protein